MSDANRCPEAGCGILMVERWRVFLGGVTKVMCSGCAIRQMDAERAASTTISKTMLAIGFDDEGDDGWSLDERGREIARQWLQDHPVAATTANPGNLAPDAGEGATAPRKPPRKRSRKASSAAGPSEPGSEPTRSAPKPPKPAPAMQKRVIRWLDPETYEIKERHVLRDPTTGDCFDAGSGELIDPPEGLKPRA